MNGLMALAPSEYEGEIGTCVVGRVVLKRGPFQLESDVKGTTAKPGKAKGKSGKNTGKTTQQNREQTNMKTEIHILGGTRLSDVLYIDGWADGAQQLANAMQEGNVYRISGAKMIDTAPRYSTSPLPYYLRVVPPIGVKTKIELCIENPWNELPQRHPFIDIGSLKRVGDSLRCCLIGVVSHQPGAVLRDTKYGSQQVCNAVIKQGTNLIQCGFWRAHGEALAQHPVGKPLALLQVNVYYANSSWGIAATESTEIIECPQELQESLLRGTDLNAEGVSLTQMVRVDYDNVRTTPATVSGLASVIQPNQLRTLDGVFEIHSVAVLGVTSVLSDDKFQMRSCKKCKAMLQAESDTCATCPDHAFEMERRWIFSFDIADNSGACKATLYHDVAQTIPFLQDLSLQSDPSNDPKTRAKITRLIRASPWSVRLIFKKMKRN